MFADHGARLGTGDLDHVAANYAEDAVFITPSGVLHGREGVKQAIGRLLADPGRHLGAEAAVRRQRDVLEWSAASPTGRRVHDGVDTFVFRDGLIRAQTVRYTLTACG
ncbi:nuclear transport factor 2 family protein [Streptomyces sp. NPDC052015]|uniref:nuclear transport factor 2 family protein n=1 Tax=Streptomyces sp. NPDC052015 TaxID=3154755 RepID=UPI00341D9CFF